MKYLVPSLIVALILLHQDYWQWNNATLDFGFLPRALSYHACISVLAAITWAIAVRWCWPEHAEVPDGAVPDDAVSSEKVSVTEPHASPGEEPRA